MARKPKPIFPKKGRAFNYEQWAPVAGGYANYYPEISQNERINILRDMTLPEDFPVALSQIAAKYPGMSPGVAVGLAGSKASQDAIAAAARIDLLNQTKFGPQQGVWRSNIDTTAANSYAYLEALSPQGADKASPKDKQDSAFFRGLKSSTRYLTTALYTPLQLIVNSARQVDAAWNASRGDRPDDAVKAGQLANDFSQIFKDTYLYQNIVNNKSLGEGYFWGGDAKEEVEQIAQNVATVNGAAYTPGRAIEAAVGIDPGERGYGILSGIIDGAITLKLDPIAIAGNIAKVRGAAKTAEQVRTGAKTAAGIVKIDIEAERVSKSEGAKLAVERTADARKRMKMSEEDLRITQKELLDEYRTTDQMIAEGKLAMDDRALTRLREVSGLDELYATRQRLIDTVEKIKPQEKITQTVPATREEALADVLKEHPNMYKTEHVAMVSTNFLKKFMEYDRAGTQALKTGSKEKISQIANDMKSGRGLENPLILEYNPDLHAFVLGEGNHRLAAAIEAGIEYLPTIVNRAEGRTRNMVPAGFEPRMFRDDTGYFLGNPNPIEILPLSVIKPIEKVTKTAGEMMRDAATGDILTPGKAAKFLREEIQRTNKQIDSAIERVYIDQDPIAKQILSRVRDDIAKNSEEYQTRMSQKTALPEIADFIEKRRAGIIETSAERRTLVEDAKRWITDGNADALFERIANADSAYEINKISKGKFGAEISAELAAAKTVDDVERVLLPRIGLDVTPDIKRGLSARYVDKVLDKQVVRGGRSYTVNDKMKRVVSAALDFMPRGRPVHLQDTEALAEEVRRWMVGARYDEADIATVWDRIVTSNEHDYKTRVSIVTDMLDKTAAKYGDELQLPARLRRELSRVTTAYQSELSGLRMYASRTVGDTVGKKAISGGDEVDLSGIPTSIDQLAHEIVLPDVNALRELTGMMSKASRFLDSKIGADVDVVERTSYAVARFTRSTSDGFLRSILMVGRVAFIIRNVMEMQVRSFLSGGKSIVTNPVETIAMAMAVSKKDGALSKFAEIRDPYLVDVNGRRFSEQGPEMAQTQGIFDSYFNMMQERGFANDGRNVRGAVRTGEFGIIKLDEAGRNAKEYADALAHRLLLHYADPMKRAIAGQVLPKKYMRAVKNGTVSFENAFLRAVREGVWKNQVDILGKSVEPIQRLLASDEGMRILFFTDQNSYATQIANDTLGNTGFKRFVAAGEVTDADGNVIFKLGADYSKNLKRLKKLIEDELVPGTQMFDNALSLELPHLSRGNAFSDNWYKTFTDWFFRQSAKVENTVVYGPEYRVAYWNNLADIAPLLSKEAASKLLESATDIKRTKVATVGDDGSVVYEAWTKKNPAFDDIVSASKSGDGFLTAEQADAFARDAAFKHVGKLFYDATQKQNFVYALQLLVPFINAWGNTLKKWSELSSSPSRIATRVMPATRLLSNLQSEESSAIYDVLGTPHDPRQGFIHENQYGEKVLTIPMSGYMRTLFGFLGDPKQADITVPVQSMNLLLAGANIPGSDIGITPGIGTQWNILYSVLPISAKDSIPPVVANLIAPYGDKSGNPLGVLPAWLQKIVNGVFGTEAAQLKFAKGIMAYEATTNPEFKVLYDGTPLSIEERSALQEKLASTAIQQSKWQYAMQGVIQSILPGTPVYEFYAKNDNNDTFFQWQMANALNKMIIANNGNFDLAYAEYATLFGRQAVLAAVSENKDLLFATDRAWQFAVDNPSAFRAYKDIIPYFFTGADFSSEYRAAMQRRGIGDKLSAAELIAESDKLTLGAVKGQLAVYAARNNLGADWIDQQMTNYKMNTLQGYEPEVTVSTNRQAQKILKIESALKRPEFANTAAGKAAVQYFEMRRAALATSAARYPDRSKPSLAGSDNIDLRMQLDQLGQQLCIGNPDFTNMYNRVLVQELRKD